MDAARFFTRVHDIDIHWAELGRGRPLVLLHGLQDSHRTWRRVAPILARGRRVIMPDLPGHGLSSRPDASYELAWYASVVGAFLDAMSIGRADVIGHSFGGGVAQSLLLGPRPRVRRLGLVAAGGLGTEVTWGLRLVSLSGVVERIGQPFMGPATRIVMRSLGRCFEPEDIAWQAWVNSMPGTAMALERTVRDVIDWRGQRRTFAERAGEVERLPPIALYWGDRDGVIPVMHTTAFQALVEGVVITHFPGCGHFPQHERPAELAHAISRFVDAASTPETRIRTKRVNALVPKPA
ncbi:Putative epoxide hydrolase [Minicystis rosea]|nr:Putative epoxide hydrolase [Minicystis rosea]